MGFENELFDVVELVRNGAIVTGNDMQTNLYRQRCLEFGYHKMCTTLIPELLKLGTLKSTERLENLVDTAVLHQKNCIRPELTQQRPAFV